MSVNILLVEDNDLLRRSLAFHLEQAGYLVNTAATAEEALAIVNKKMPDLVLLDIGLPGMDGLDALPHFRQRLNIPVIFITGRRRELDEILGLELGADDYITKPINEDVLLTRIKVVLRRTRNHPAGSQMAGPLVVGDLTIDAAAHTVLLNNKPISLSPREFTLLQTLALKVGQVLSVEELLTQAWGAEYEGQPQVVYVHIRWLREKIEVNPNQPERIITVRGVGYKLQSKGM
jgi:DNA-binding response OmpR family regulator